MNILKNYNLNVLIMNFTYMYIFNHIGLTFLSFIVHSLLILINVMINMSANNQKGYALPGILIEQLSVTASLLHSYWQSVDGLLEALDGLE